MQTATLPEELRTYFNLMSLNGGARAFHTALDTGVFDSLIDRPSTAEQVAQRTGLHTEPTRLLLDVLCALDVLTRTANSYALTPVMQLLAGPYRRLGDEYWDHLETLLRTGEPLKRMDDTTQSEQQYQAQAMALAWMLRPAAEAAAERLSGHGPRILDVGAGAAVWSLALAAREPAATITAIDWPAVLQLAQATATQFGMADRFTALPGNYHEVDLENESFDLAIVANVTHLETPKGNRHLFERVHRTLKPDGELVIVDVFPGQPTGDLSRSLYALGLALRTEQGHVYTQTELAPILTQAGFQPATFTPIPAPPHTMGLLRARQQPQAAEASSRRLASR